MKLIHMVCASKIFRMQQDLLRIFMSGIGTADSALCVQTKSLGFELRYEGTVLGLM